MTDPKYVMCTDCLKQMPYTDERHEGEELCDCGGEYCGCCNCLNTLKQLKKGETKKEILGTVKDINSWTVNGINQQ